MSTSPSRLSSLFCHARRRVLLAALAGTLFACGIVPAWSQEASVDVPVEPSVESPADPNLNLLTPEQLEVAVKKWEDDIQKLEKLDQDEPDPSDAVLLLGSSSIRLWENAAEAMEPYPIIRRGYGGAKFSDLLVYARRLIEPHEFRAAVIFVGNDVSGSKSDHEIDAVEKWMRAIVEIAREHQPDAPILLVEVTPTPSRFGAWPEIRELNERMREVALTEPNTYFVATAEFYLDRNDEPRPEFFRQDRLHQNDAGYAIWASLIKRRLDEVLAGS